MAASHPSWLTFIAPRRGLLEAHLCKRLKDESPGETVVVVRSGEDQKQWLRLLGAGVPVVTLSRFLGRAGAGIEDEDLLPPWVAQWMVAEALPQGYKDAARDHLAAVCLEAIALLEQNGIRPPYPGQGATQGEHHLEAAHDALLRGLARQHDDGRFLAFERVSQATACAPQLFVAYPEVRRVVFFGFDYLSPAERVALLHVTGQAPTVEWFVLGRLPEVGERGMHAGLELTDPLVDWLAGAGPVEGIPVEAIEQAAQGGRTVSVAGLFSLTPPKERRPAPGVHVDPAPDRALEVERLLARVRGLLDAGVAPQEIGVIVPGMADYAGALEDAFAEHRIDASISYRGPLRTSAPGSFVIALLDALESGLVRDAVLDLVDHRLAAFPLLDDPDPEAGPTATRLDASRLRAYMQEAGLNPRGVTHWRRVGPILEKRWQSQEQAAAARRALYADAMSTKEQEAREVSRKQSAHSRRAQWRSLLLWVERLDALDRERDPLRFLAGVRSLLDEAGLREQLHQAARRCWEPQKLLAAYRGLVSLLDEVEEAFSLAPEEASVRWVREVLRRALAQKEVPLPVDPEVGVQVVSWRNARGRTFRHAFVIGATQDALPESDDEVAVEELLGQRFAQRLERLDRAQEARRVLHGILADTTGQVVLSAPQYEGEAPVVRSVLLDELEEVFELAPADEPPVGPFTLRTAGRMAVTRDLPVAGAPVQAEAAHRLVWARWHGEPGSVYSGHLVDPKVRALRVTRPVSGVDAVSANRLSGFAKCPFKALVTKGMRIEAPRVRDEDVDPLDRGNLLHAILERFTLQAIEDWGAPLRVMPVARADHEALLLTVAIDEITKMQQRSVAWDAQKEALLGGLPGSANPYRSAPKGLLARFLDHLEGFGEGEGVLAVEVGFGPGGASRDDDGDQEGGGQAHGAGMDEAGSGRPAGPAQAGDEVPVDFQTSGGTITLRGRIDRLDLVHDEETGDAGLRVVEYKTGSIPKKDLIVGGVEFQLPIYAWVAEKLHPDRLVLTAAYHQMKRPRDAEARMPTSGRFDRGGKNDLDALMEQTPVRVGQILEAEQAGRFPLTLLEEQEAGCGWCELRRTCGLRPELLGSRREAARGGKPQGAQIVGYVPDRIDLKVFEADEAAADGADAGARTQKGRRP